MPRLLVLLIMLVFAATNGVAAPMALCQHGNGKSHAAAIASGDLLVTAAAHSEEAAAAAAEKQGSLADAAAGALSAALLPDQIGLRNPVAVEHRTSRPADADFLPSLAVAPLLDPPLA